MKKKPGKKRGKKGVTKTNGGRRGEDNSRGPASAEKGNNHHKEQERVTKVKKKPTPLAARREGINISPKLLQPGENIGEKYRYLILRQTNAEKATSAKNVQKNGWRFALH